MPTQKKVLCVDDDSGTCELIALILRDCQVTSAANKAEALHLASSSKFDLVFLDNNLPDGLGVEIMRRHSHQRPRDADNFCDGGFFTHRNSNLYDWRTAFGQKGPELL
jgi:CheY-like chemotaxis protein